MTLSELIERLEKMPQDKVVPFGFGDPHSYRGYYDQLAFAPRESVRVADMLADAKSAMGKTFEGYKGGDYEMGPYTEVNIAHYGSCGDGISHMLLDYMERS
jgi:hypothetical protein